MSSFDLPVTETWMRLAGMLVHSLWQGAVVAALLLLVFRFHAPRRSTQRYAWCLVALLLMLACPVATFWLIDPVPETAFSDTPPVDGNRVAQAESPPADSEHSAQDRAGEQSEVRATRRPQGTLFGVAGAGRPEAADTGDDSLDAGVSDLDGVEWWRFEQAAFSASGAPLGAADSLADQTTHSSGEASAGVTAAQTVSAASPHTSTSPHTAAQPFPTTAHRRRSAMGARWVDRWAVPIVSLWLCGVLLMSVRLVWGVGAVFQLKRTCRAIPERLQDLVAETAARLGWQTPPRVALSDRLRDAAAVGFFRPMVLLPAAWVTGLPADVLQAVIAHELAHLRRWDPWVMLLERVAETLFFYHPVVWWLTASLRAERELCCDELAVSVTGHPVAYAQALEQVARFALAGGRPAMAAPMGGGRKMALLNRVRNVLGAADGRRPLGWWWTGLLAVLVPLGLSLSALAFAPRTSQNEQDRLLALVDDDRGDGDRTERERERGEAERERGDRERGQRDRERGERERERGERERRDKPRADEAHRDRDRREDEAARDRERAERHRAEDRERREREREEVEHRLLNADRAVLIERIRQLERELQALRARQPGGPGIAPPSRDGRFGLDVEIRRHDRRHPEGERPHIHVEVRRDGERAEHHEGERPREVPPHERPRVNVEIGRVPGLVVELMQQVRALREEVQDLRNSVRELREERRADHPPVRERIRRPLGGAIGRDRPLPESDAPPARPGREGAFDDAPPRRDRDIDEEREERERDEAVRERDDDRDRPRDGDEEDDD